MFMPHTLSFSDIPQPGTDVAAFKSSIMPFHFTSAMHTTAVFYYQGKEIHNVKIKSCINFNLSEQETALICSYTC